MSTRLRRLQYSKVALVNQGANQLAHITLFKRQDPMPKTRTAEELQAELDTVTKAEADAKAQIATLTAKVEELTTQIAPESEEDVEKTLPEPVQKELARLRKQADEDRAAVQKMQDERDRNAAIRKASDFKALGNPDDLGGLLYDLRKAAPKVAEQLEARMKAWHEQIKASKLFEETGSGEAAADTPEGKLDALAKKYHGEHPDLTPEQAFAKVMDTKEGKALYAQIRGGK